MTIGTVKLWDPATGAASSTFKGHSSVTAMALSPDSKLVASASYDNTARLWDPSTSTARSTLEHSHWVTAIAFSPDGKLVASASRDSTVRLWDSASGAVCSTITTGSYRMIVLFWLQNSRQMANW